MGIEKNLLIRSKIRPKLFKNISDIQRNFRLNSSKTLIKFVKYISSLKDYPILDVPCGFGRHSFLFSSLGSEVICVDINQDALNYIVERQKEFDFVKPLTTQKIDLEKSSWEFKKQSIGAIVNVHYYKHDLLDKFTYSLMSGGFLYLETPGGYGENYIDLPEKDCIRNKLEPHYKLLFYREDQTGPVKLNRVTVKVLAQKIAKREIKPTPEEFKSDN